MFSRYFSLLLLVVGISLIGLFVNSGCASIVPPSGGYRDTLPPMVLHVDPANETKNFDAKKITFTFNEYVELQDAYKNLIVSPLPKSAPDVQRRLKTVTVKLRDTLLPNTTYTLNFSKAIKDVNEGNQVKDLLYVVSTGDYFDSLQLSGSVRIAKTDKPDSTLMVMLHTSMDDSAVVKQKPKYVARLDSSGLFLFRNLAPGNYKLYAIKDESGSYMYATRQQLFAFADSPIIISDTMPKAPVRLWAYDEEEKKAGSGEAPELDKKEKRLKFTSNLQGGSQDLLDAFIMTFESPLKKYDSTKLSLSTDSTFTPAVGNTFTLDSTRTKLTLNMPWAEAQKYHLILDKEFASDSLDRQLLKTDTISFTTKAKKDYGQVRIAFKGLDFAQNPVLLITSGQQIKSAFPLNSNVINIQLYLPGDYEMQILLDSNKNKIWDPGDFFGKRTQPELIIPLERKLNVKANWETDFEVQVKR